MQLDYCKIKITLPSGSAGFSLLNVVISLATLFIIAGSLIKVQNQTGQYTLSSQQERDSSLLINDIYANLKELKSCTDSFKDTYRVEDKGTGIYSSPTAIKKPDGSTAAFTINSADSSGRLIVKGLTLGDFEAPDPLFPNDGRAKLIVEIEKTGNPLGPKTIKREVLLQVKRKLSGSDNVVDTCYAVGGGEELWTRNPNGSIYYKGGDRGFVGIGTTSPKAHLHMVREPASVATAGDDQDLVLEQYNNDDNSNPLFSGYRARGTSVAPLKVENGDELLSFKSLGYDGDEWINAAQITFRVDGATGAGQIPTRIDFHTRPPGNIGPANTPGPVRMTIKANGLVGIGTQTPGQRLDVVGNIQASVCLYAGGTGFAGPSCVSDYRLKSDIRPYRLGLDALKGFKPKTFRYNGLGGTIKSTDDQIGVIAQDIEKTAPQLVTNFKAKLHPDDKSESQIRAVNHTPFIYVVINAVKELYSQWSHKSRDQNEELSLIEKEINEIEKLNKL